MYLILIQFQIKQCSHATLGCYKTALKSPKLLSYWEDNGQPKVVLKCEEEKEL